MMRLTYVCSTCPATVRREMPSGKGGSPQGGSVKCPKGHGNMSRKGQQDLVAICGLTIYGRKRKAVGRCRLPPKHEGQCQRLG